MGPASCGLGVAAKPRGVDGVPELPALNGERDIPSWWLAPERGDVPLKRPYLLGLSARAGCENVKLSAKSLPSASGSGDGVGTSGENAPLNRPLVFHVGTGDPCRGVASPVRYDPSEATLAPSISGGRPESRGDGSTASLPPALLPALLLLSRRCESVLCLPRVRKFRRPANDGRRGAAATAPTSAGTAASDDQLVLGGAKKGAELSTTSSAAAATDSETGAPPGRVSGRVCGKPERTWSSDGSCCTVGLSASLTRLATLCRAELRGLDSEAASESPPASAKLLTGESWRMSGGTVETAECRVPAVSGGLATPAAASRCRCRA